MLVRTESRFRAIRRGVGVENGVVSLEVSRERTSAAASCSVFATGLDASGKMG